MTAPVKVFREGDVLHYEPQGAFGRHCRECIAIVREDGRAVDTYWNGGGDAHVLTERELETATLRFNLADFRVVESERDWQTYATEDRQIVTSQHGHQQTHYVRIGAEPDLATQIENAREAVRAAESEQRMAEWGLTRRRDELAELLSKRGGS